MTDAFLQDHIEVEYDGSKYRFKIPTISDEMKQGFLERKIRQDLENDILTPEERQVRRSNGELYGLDDSIIYSIRAIATFQLLLKSSDCPDNWPFSKDAIGKPIIDYKTWNPEKLTEAISVWMLFLEQRRRFREGRTGTDGPGKETVASGQNPGT